MDRAVSLSLSVLVFLSNGIVVSRNKIIYICVLMSKVKVVFFTGITTIGKLSMTMSRGGVESFIQQLNDHNGSGEYGC